MIRLPESGSVSWILGASHVRASVAFDTWLATEGVVYKSVERVHVRAVEAEFHGRVEVAWFFDGVVGMVGFKVVEGRGVVFWFGEDLAHGVFFGWICVGVC